MSYQTNVTELFEIDYPILQGSCEGGLSSVACWLPFPMLVDLVSTERLH
jgi:hypothetical protein